MLDKLKPPAGATHRVKTVGRGPGCHGKTSGRGHKGQRARSGGRVAAWFEGGQTPLKMRSPKRGFTHSAKTVYDLINVDDLNRFAAGDTITPEELKKAGLISGKNRVKVLGDGELTLNVNIKAHGFSKQAIKKVEERGGKTEVL